MACYVIESDTIFISCKDTNVIEVYEIDSLHLAPVRQKYWTLLATVHLGDGQEFDELRIGDRDIIRGVDLEKLMKDLMSLGMMVNREGLCFLKSSDECREAEYLRMFDVFDWSKYYVKSKQSTRWVRNDIVTGRPVLEMSSERDNAELIENKRLHSEESTKLKHRHNEEIDELVQKHLGDLAKFERRREEEMKAMRDEIERREQEIEDMKKKKKLQLYCYESSEGNIEGFYSRLVDHLRVRFPRSKFKASACTNGNNKGKFYVQPDEDDHIKRLTLIPVCSMDPYDFPDVEVCLHGKRRDFEDWYLIEVEMMFTVKKRGVPKSQQRNRFLYYDGEPRCILRFDGVTYPSFADNARCISCIVGCGLYHVLGVGFRLGFLLID